ncbi:MAG TPA: xanthine dehydrogenase family protein subunit M [Thermoplasmata archaeon]|nr:xanthine dehydrogenase family protein subunit M [Thermoplasmata archaeon]
MQPHAFGYARATSVAEAVRLLRKNGDRAKILAGGQSLIPLMKLRLANPEFLIDIGGISELSALREDGEGLSIGAMVRDREFEHAELVKTRYPILGDVVKGLGDPQVRNLGTVGGSLAHADPAGDWGAALLALDAHLTLTGPRGERQVPIDEFFKDTFATALHPDEILTEIRLPAPVPHSGSAYQKLKRKTGDFATVSASARLALNPGGAIVEARLGLGAVGPTAIRAPRAEAFLAGKSPDEATFAEAGRLASQESSPVPDLHGSAEYKRAMVAVMVRRALETAAARARS